MKNFANFHQSTFKSLKIGTFTGSFYPKQKMYEFKIYRGVMSLQNEEWCRIWSGLDLSIQNWYEEFDEFWPEPSKISKIWTLMSCFWLKYIMYELKKVQRKFDCTEDWCKIWRQTDLYFLKWHEEFDKFSPEQVRKSENWVFSWVFLSKVENVWAWNL